MRRTPVYIVCSPRPMVGRTTVARLLTEFLKLQRGAVAAFDVNLKEPSLLDYLPRLTETADVENTFGQMALMDRLIVNDGIAKVIDLGYHAFDDFFRMCAEIGFIKEAKRRGIAPVILFVADSDRASIRGFETLQTLIPRGSLVVIDNEFTTRGELPDIMIGYRTIRISGLPAFIKTYISRVTFSFTQYLRNEKDTSTELHQWTRDAYFKFRELELGLILGG
jgi:hypothetical protein